jgi:hypothetical protein
MIHDAPLDDFLARFGDPNKQAANKPLPKVESVSTIGSGGGLIQSAATKPTADLSNMEGELKATLPTAKAPGMGAMDMANTAMGVATSGMQLIDNIKGGQFDTSAEGGGVGKAGGAIMQGAATGAEFGGEIGKLAGPLGQAIGTGVGAIGGGLVSTFAHKAAKIEYADNRKTHNLKEDALATSKRRKDYQVQEGLESMKALKSLREKQLGIS